MTTIREFRITNLAGRGGELHRVLHPQVNVFWGLNGTGKTTLLQILDAALTNKTSDLAALPFDSAEVTFYSDRHDVEFTRYIEKNKLSAELSKVNSEWQIVPDLELDDEVGYRLRRSEADIGWETSPSKPLRDKDALTLSYKHSYLPISRMLEPARSDRVANDSAEGRFVRRVNQVWSRYSAKSLAQIRDIQQLGLAEVLSILFEGRAQTAPVLEGLAPADDEHETVADDAFRIVSEFLRAQRIWLPLGQSDFMARYEESSVHRHVVTRIRSVMSRVDQVLAPQQELQSVIEEMYIGNKHLVLNPGSGPRGRVEIEIESESIPLSSLSSGEKQLLQLLLETLAVEESTIMIDEPEISLHPDWQRGLVSSMRRVNREAQFLLATHSPELMVDVEEECVFEL